MSSLPYTNIDAPKRSKFGVAGVALMVVGAVVGAAGFVGMRSHGGFASFTSATTSDKVNVYIIAEAFCPNCKKHSYLFDTLVMDKGDDMREIMDLKLDMMVLEGWNEAEDKGMCERGEFDCETAKYHLVGQELYDDATHTWWDFSRCLYKSQPELIAYYYATGHSDADLLESTVETCADDLDLDYGLLKSTVEEKGTHLLKESYGRVLEYGDPVWIYVNGKYIEYEDDWINAICAAYDGDAPSACGTQMSLDGGSVALKSESIFPSNDKVDVYIVAEAMCPNCREHSYYFDNLVMTPEGTKSGVRSHMNLVLEQMLIDGWNEDLNVGMCEKGKWDCELSKYHLCAQNVEGFSEEIKWWDYSRCLYEHQTEMIDYYYYDGGEDASLLNSVHESCAKDAGMDSESIDTCVSTEGTSLLYAGYERIGKMSDPVWIYVNAQRIDYHEDWLSTICAAIEGNGDSTPDECTFEADV